VNCETIAQVPSKWSEASHQGTSAGKLGWETMIMDDCRTRREILHQALTASVLVVTAGCGTVLHPERRGQEAGPLDWNVVALDAVGLLFFFVPGVIAFAVDFNNGTIYLPPDRYTGTGRGKPQRQLVSRGLGDDVTRTKVEEIVSEHVDQPVRLTAGMFQTRPLDHIRNFWRMHTDFMTS
jgi:hypothetical protein